MREEEEEPDETEPKERPCEVCQEIRCVVRRVGPLLVKAPCPNKCGA